MSEHVGVRLLPRHQVAQYVQILAEVEDYNHRLMNVPHMWRETRGGGVKLVVLDTGKPEHPDLSVVRGESFVGDDGLDRQGHGTHCCGIIAAIADNDLGTKGIAPDVMLYTGKVLGDDGSGSWMSIAAGIRWAVDEVGADIVSLSLGGGRDMPDGQAMKNACDHARERGVAIFAAAGNDYDRKRVCQPARFDSVFAVAAVDSRKRHAAFSNGGKEIEFAAGGVNVFSTYLDNGYAKLSGTSMSCPALAAAAALVQASHKQRGERLAPDRLRQHLERICVDVGPDGWDSSFGHGIPFFRRQSSLPPPPARQWTFVDWLRHMFKQGR